MTGTVYHIVCVMNCILCDELAMLSVFCCSLSVRGMKSDSAVLCTNEESFELKEAETSNSLLILPQCEFTAQSLSCCSQPSAISRQVVLSPALSLLSTFTHSFIHSVICLTIV